MNKKTISLTLGILLMAVLLAACELPASRAPETQPTATMGILAFTRTPTSIKDAVSTQPTQKNTPTANIVTPQTTQLAATATVNVSNVPTPVRPSTYTLKSGEWLICIARRYNLDLSSFLSLNGYDMSSRPSSGISLKIPSTGTWSTEAYGKRSLKAHPTTYTASSGDTIYSIACEFGDVAPEQIITANNLTTPYTLTSGKILQIP
jgi:LysM repeat protein